MSHFNSHLRRSFCLLSLVLLTPTLVWSQVDTSRAVSFGDSLTDNDSLFFLFGTDPLIYGTDPFEAAFDKAAQPADTLTNYAVLGSTSADVLDQVVGYAVDRFAGNRGPATLISLQSGGNDFLTEENLLVLASASPGENRSADSIVDHVRRNVLISMGILRLVDRRAPIVVWTVPDVTLTPYMLSLGFDQAAQTNVSLHIERLNRWIHRLSRHRRVAVLDLAGVLVEVSAVPPVIDGIQMVPPPTFGFAAAVFADPIHPTAVSNGLIANELIRTVNQRFSDTIPLYTDVELGQRIVP